MEKGKHKKVGERVRSYRETQGLPQRETAVAVGISQTHLCRIEAGGEMTLTTFLRLCKFFRTSPNQLADWT